jgi:hypothetical protein
VYLALSNWELYSSSSDVSYKNKAVKNIEKAMSLHPSDEVKKIYNEMQVSI